MNGQNMGNKHQNNMFFNDSMQGQKKMQKQFYNNKIMKNNNMYGNNKFQDQGDNMDF